MSSYFDVGSIVRALAGRLTVKSALNPILWLVTVLTLPCFIMATVVRDDRPLMWFFIGLGTIAALLAIAAAGYFAFRAPHLLQSEDFQLRNQSLQMLQGKQGDHVIDATVMIANPTAGALPPAGNGE